MLYECKICSRTDFKKIINLSKHLSNNHKFKPKDYYDLYMKKENEGICEFCNNPTLYQNMSSGYRNSCRSCRSLSTKKFRKELKEDENRYKQFTEKVAKNQTEIWKNRKETGEDRLIHTKVGNTAKEKNALMTPEERKDRFGWMNKLSSVDLEIWKNNVMFNTGMYKWHTNATADDIKNIVKRRSATILSTQENLVKLTRDYPNDYRKYVKAVEYITTRSYSISIDQIDPSRLRGKQWHLDHMYSIRAGFENSIDPRIIGSSSNLSIIPASDNMKKGAKCSITLEQLIERYNHGKL